VSLPRHIVSINVSPDVLALLELILNDEGYRVTSRSYEDLGLPELEALAPDLILIDYMWPSDDDNWALLRRIRLTRTLRSVPIVLCTGAIAETRSMASHLATMQVHILWQPFDLDQLLGTVDAALNNQATTELSADAAEGTPFASWEA
jgi:CheY-like chemotaxis protein